MLSTYLKSAKLLYYMKRAKSIYYVKSCESILRTYVKALSKSYDFIIYEKDL